MASKIPVAFALSVLVSTAALVARQARTPPDWKAVEEETLRHYQALVRLDTTTKERAAAEYVKRVLDDNGVPAQLLALEPDHPNVVARLKGSGRKRPLLVMGHMDTVSVDAAKWHFPPFSATRDGGYVYGRGTIDDKDNLTAGLMTMLLLKRHNVPLDRDVIFLAESGEEGNSRVGIGFMVAQHFADIDAEYCLAEGGDVIREHGEVKYAEVETTEKIPRGIELVARGISGHGSVPLKSNAVVHLAAAVGRVGEWRPDIKLNETTGTYFRRLATVAPPEQAKIYRDVLSPDPKVARAADDWLFENEPRHSSMLRTSVSPNIIQGGYRSNIIPSEAKATLDVRMVPDEDRDGFLEQVRRIVNDPAIDVHFTNAGGRPSVEAARLDSEVFRTLEATVTKIYNAITLPSMSTGATDMAQMRAKGAQCFGIGSAVDVEDQAKGFAQHSDQERLLESELYRFVRFNWEVVTEIAGGK
ncbi:MAG TPA: M20/M25/M40 family metallo-hydrolase [Vicinamibacterales bacterium]|jgi:acetylornithine deacetylase/succinyl-diaminopimelate desuccinylase-like protein|nr:M20/M25/M40 family metallo-hydrolase [Vicinamibacterales bacterium]